MHKIKCKRWNDRMPVQNLGSFCADRPRTHHLNSRNHATPLQRSNPFNYLTFLTRHPSPSLITAGRLLSRKNIFWKKRTQTLPVFIDDREKTNPKRTQTEAKRTQKLSPFAPLKPYRIQTSGTPNPEQRTLNSYPPNRPPPLQVRIIGPAQMVGPAQPVHWYLEVEAWSFSQHGVTWQG
jgi:hypothetical protein